MLISSSIGILIAAPAESEAHQQAIQDRKLRTVQILIFAGAMLMFIVFFVVYYIISWLKQRRGARTVHSLPT